MFDKTIKDVLTEHNGLSFNEHSLKLEGRLFISELDWYEIIVDVSPFPYHFPKVFEIGDRIPRKLSRHKFNNSDQCCLTTAANSQILIKTKIDTLIKFFDLILVPYLQNNSFFEINRKYLQGEYSHGTEGILEGYQDILGIQDPLIIAEVIRGRIEGRKLTIRDKCFCGNGKTMKKCSTHLANYRKFRHIQKDVLISDLIEISILINQAILKMQEQRGLLG